MRRFLVPCAVLALYGCSPMVADKSAQMTIQAEMKQAAQPQPRAEAAPSASVTNSLLPPLRVGLPKTSARQLEQRFDLVVTDAPVNQVLMAIVADTRYSILVSPRGSAPAATPGAPGAASGANAPVKLQDALTVNLKDVTVFEALDAIRELYGYEYSVDGNRIYVQPPEMKTRLFQVNYILGQRRGVSDLQVIGGASSGGGGSGSSGSSGSSSGSSSSGSGSSSGYGSIQASALSSISKSDIWSELEDSARTVLGCQIARSQPARSTTGGTTAGSSSSSSNSGGGSRADVSFVGDSQTGERMRGVEGCTEGRALSINQMSGTILVRAMPRELRLIENLLKSMQANIERQVIIEAKIIDVELNADSQQGINWAGFSQGLHKMSVGANTSVIDGTPVSGGTGGTVAGGTSLSSLLGSTMVGVATPNAFSQGLGVALQFANFSALINFLQTQGRVQVLSGPRISTLNNQKAVLKVGSEEPFVTNISGGGSNTTNGVIVTTPPSLNYQPFFSGISLDVTPQIDDSDNITLHVHSMVNSIIEKQKISLPVASAAMVPFAVNNISETDSVVRTKDGQVVVIGGLMTESSSNNQAKVPGVGDTPGLGALFRNGGQKTTKRELVILLKPTVVKSDSGWAGDISATQGRIEGLNTAPPPAN